MIKVKQPLKIYHITNQECKHLGALTVATEVTDNDCLRLGFAFCSPEDRFTKRIGRKIAMGRMLYLTKFTGHSSDDLVKYLNEHPGLKPTRWKNAKLVSLKEAGITILEKVQ